MIYGVLDRPISALQQLNLSRLNMGVQRVLMLRPDTPSPSLPREVLSLEVLTPQVTIPSQETTYWCHVYQLPANMPKNHIVMVRGQQQQLVESSGSLERNEWHETRIAIPVLQNGF